MNKIKWAVALMALLSISDLTGCKTSPQTSAYKAEGVIITTVDTGMRAWASYVRAGKATQAQVDTVKAMYKRYYDAQQVAKFALKKAVTSKNPQDIPGAQVANDAVANAQTSLLILLNSLIK
jgi:hypothetical protein